MMLLALLQLVRPQVRAVESALPSRTRRYSAQPERPPGCVEFAVSLFGERCIRLADRRELPGRSALVWPDGELVTHLRRDLNARQAAFHRARALAPRAECLGLIPSRASALR